jgi:hypothetical protein
LKTISVSIVVSDTRLLPLPKLGTASKDPRLIPTSLAKCHFVFMCMLTSHTSHTTQAMKWMIVSSWLVLAIMVVGAAANEDPKTTTTTTTTTMTTTLHWWVSDADEALEACDHGTNDWMAILEQHVTVHWPLETEQDRRRHRRRRRVQANKYCWLSGDPTKCPPPHGVVAPRPQPMPVASAAAVTAPMPSIVSNVTASSGGGGGVRALRTVASATVKELDCDQAQRAAYHNAFQDLSLWTRTCRDYIGRHVTEWVCQFH